MSRFNLYEFFIPENIAAATDASDYPGATTFFEETVDVTVMSGTEQADTLSSIFRELGASASRISEQFSRLFSFAKKLGDEGVIHKEARAVMGEKLPTLLREVNKIAGRFLTSAAAKNATPEAYEDACLALRSSTKMYAFLICHLLRSRCVVVQEAGASQPSALARRAAAKRGRTARAGASSIPADEDESGMNSITREMCITSLNEVLASDLSPIWRRTGEAVEMPLCQLMLRTALHMVGQKNNIDGIDASAGSSDTNPVAMALVLWSANLTSRFGRQYCLDRTGSLDLVISPLVERLLRSPHPLHCSRFITRQIAIIDDSSRSVGADASFSEKHWSYVFLAALFSGIAHAALTDVVGDGPAAKAVAQLLEELAQHRISVIAIFFDSFIEPLLNSESYEVRKAALTCQAEMIVQTLVGSPSAIPAIGLDALDIEVVQMIRPLASEFQPNPAPTTAASLLEEPDALLDGSDVARLTDDNQGSSPPPPTVEHVKNKYLRSLWTRLRDLNPFARLHCVKLWIDLVERRSVPKCFYLPLVLEATGRLSDRNYLVRRASLMLLQACLGRAWFGLVLQRTLLAKTRDEHIQSAARKYAEEVQQRQQEGVADADPPQSFDEFLEFNRQLAKAADERALSGESGHNFQLPSPLTTAIITCDRAIEFSAIISEALGKAAELLDSKTLADVTQSINFIVSCVHNRVDNSIQTALRMLSLIFSEEPTVKAAVSKAFVDIFFNLPQLTNIASVPLKTVNLARAHKMIGVIAVANEGDLYAMEEILETNRKEQGTVLVNEKLLDAVMSILMEGTDDESADHMMKLNRERERRVTMQLYALLVSTLPRDIQTRKADLIDLIDRYSNDNIFLSHVWDALSKEVRVPGFAPIDEARLPIPKDPNSHPLLQRALHHLCRPTANLGTWVVMAGSIINYVHSCYSVPSKIYTMVSSFLTNSIIEGYVRATSAAESGGDSRAPPPLAKVVTSPYADQNRVGQLFFVTGQSAIKHLVTIDNNEREQMRLIDERAKAAPLALPNSGDVASPRDTTRASARAPSQAAPAAEVDVMHKELGLASTAHQRYELQEAYQKAKNDMLANAVSLWAINSKVIASYLMTKGVDELTANNPVVRIAACTALTRLCIASEQFCSKHLRLLFTILSSKKEHWAVKTNTIIAMGDMLCVYPNTLEPYLELETTGFYALLSDPDVRVRSITVQVCTFLILNDMLKVRDHLHTIMRLVADPDPTIAGNATQFIHHLAIKQKRNIGNLIPPLVPQLSSQMSQEHFQFAMRVLLEKVEGDKAIEGVVEKLCIRFSRYVDERTKTKKAQEQRILARNLAFCIVEMDCTSERIMKRLMSETMYTKYKQWLRDSEVLASFQSLSTKLLRRTGGAQGGTERRDRLAIEEWSQRMLVDASVLAPVAPYGRAAATGDQSEDDNVDDEMPAVAPARNSTASSPAAGAKRGRTSGGGGLNEEEDEMLLGRHAAASTALMSQTANDDDADESPRRKSTRSEPSRKATPKPSGKGKGKRRVKREDSDDTSETSDSD